MSMRIEPVSDADASPEVKRIFDALAPGGKVAPFFRMLARKPAALGRELEAAGEPQGSCLPAGIDSQRLRVLNEVSHRLGEAARRDRRADRGAVAAWRPEGCEGLRSGGESTPTLHRPAHQPPGQHRRR